MKNQAIQFCIFFVLSVFCFISCKKENKEVVPPAPKYVYYPVANELKEYGLFQPGSYWINRIDSASTLTDSVYVRSVSTNTYSIWETEDSIVVAEKITVNFGNNPAFSNRYYSSFILSSYPYNNITVIKNQLPFIIFELDSTNISPTLGNGMIENKSLSNYVLNNVNFGNCRYLSYAYTYSKPSNPPLWYYSLCVWKKNVGLVKNRNTSFHDICDLLRYSIVH